MPYAPGRLAGSLAGVALFTFGALGVFITRQQQPSPFVAQLCRAGLCPDEFSVERVFLLKQQSQLPGGAPLVLPLMQRALLQDNASAYKWTDLGDVELAAGHLAQAQNCFEQALQAAPHSPVILFRAANFDWQTGDATGALRKLYRVLSNPELADVYDTAFLTYSRLKVPLPTVLALGVPEQRLPAERFLRFTMLRQNVDSASGIWQWMSAHNLTSDVMAGEYCRFLATSQHPALAAEAWRSYAHSDPAFQQTNWVFNGGFEAPFRPSLFDWQAESTANVAAERTDRDALSGSHALHLQFLGHDNSAYAGAGQFVAIPAGAWRLRAQIKTNGLTTNEGIRLHVVDYFANTKLDAWSDMVAGSTDWNPLDLVFHSGPGVRLLQIQLARQSSLLFNERVQGSVWIDDVQLTRSGAAPETAWPAHSP